MTYDPCADCTLDDDCKGSSNDCEKFVEWADAENQSIEDDEPNPINGQ